MKLVIAVVLSAALIALHEPPALTIQHAEAKASTIQAKPIKKKPIAKKLSLKSKKRVEPGKKKKPMTPKAIAKQMAKQRGWTGHQWKALETLWQNESGWNPNATNPSSGACGIPQAWPCSKLPDRTVRGQLRWGMNYIQKRYSTPAKALAHWQAKVPVNGRNMGHWY